MASRVLVDEPVATVANRPRPCFRRSAACLARPRRQARVRGSFPGLTARLGHARETPTGTAVVDAGRWATRRGPFLIGDDPFTCRGEACLARPRRMARERGVVSGPGGPDGSGAPNPYRDGGGLSATGGRCVSHRPSFATPCRGEACLARPRRMARERGVVSGPGGPDGSGAPNPYRHGGGLSATGGRCVSHRPSFATPCRGEACLARPRRMARERFAALMA
jgi:hypothetical protein